MFLIRDSLYLEETSVWVIWIVFGAGLIIFAPKIAEMLKSLFNIVTGFIGKSIYLYKMNRKDKGGKDLTQEITEGLTHNIQRSKRSYSFESKKGELVSPFYDETITKYRLANILYPEQDDEAYKRAKELDMEYFLNREYPYDYIVLGHRAAIEEARKGNRLTGKEEALIWLGYGYDNRPFGEPWGLEDEMFDDYLYAEREGDFLEWFLDLEKFDRYLKAGYEAPRDAHDTVNRDKRIAAERRVVSFGGNSKRLTKERYNRLKQQDHKKDTNVRELDSVNSKPTIKA